MSELKKPDTALRKRLDDHSIWVETKGIQGRRLVEHGDALRLVDLSGEYLWNVDFSDADLKGSIFRNSNMWEVDLRNADLRWEDLSMAELFRADLRDVDLSNAVLRKAKLTGASMSGAILPATDRILELPKWRPHIQQDWIRIGCQYHTTEEWANFTDEQISVMDYRALDWWLKHRDLILTTARECESYPED